MVQYISGHNRTLLYFTVQSSLVLEGKDGRKGREGKGVDGP